MYVRFRLSVPSGVIPPEICTTMKRGNNVQKVPAACSHFHLKKIIKNVSCRSDFKKRTSILARTVPRWIRLGGVLSILSYRSDMSQAPMPASECSARDISDSFVRLSVGLEEADDLTADPNDALQIAGPMRGRLSARFPIRLRTASESVCVGRSSTLAARFRSARHFRRFATPSPR